MGKIIQIEVSESIGVLLEREKILKEILAELIEKKLNEYLLTVYALDSLTQKSELTEEEILEIDKEVKKGIAKKWENEINSGH